ncbi:MAG: PfkB family carbohydrate kinase, partial [Spirochaetaceae bacterium]
VETVEQAQEAARFLLSKGLKRIIVTLGDRGSLYATKESHELIPAVLVDSVDSTGAGDAFIGCFASTFIKTQSIAEALRQANAYAALSTTKPGTQKSLVGTEEFESFLKSLA